MLKIIASILAFVIWLSALCGTAQAGSALAFHMAVPNMPSFSPVFPRVDGAGLEKYCLALAIYHEARGEPLPGQLAVAVTILNRVRSGAYPDTVCGVVFQNSGRLHRCQFSFACDRRSDVPKNAAVFVKSMHMAEFTSRMKTYLDSGPHAGSPFAVLGDMTHYHRHDVHPVWSKKLHRLQQIGSHVFFRSDRVVRRYRDADPETVQVAFAGY
jgi:hypothetical protein